MTINDLTNKTEYKKFKLIKADYNKNSDEITITFLYSNFNLPTDAEKESLKKEALSILGNLTKNTIKD